MSNLRDRPRLNRVVSILTAVHLIAGGPAATGDELPEVSERPPLAAAHFPDAVHAFVWRNWELVEPERLARILGTTTENVIELAASMGLPRTVSVPREMQQRGYITLIRRNWHLLPYEQLTELLDISAEELALRLREDDFLYTKLGSLKPHCPVLKYRPPDPAAQRRAQEIESVLRRQFGDQLATPAEPRFGFVAALGRPPDEFTPAPRAPDSRPGPRFIYSYCATFGDPLADPTLETFPEGLLARLGAQGVNGIWLHTVLRQISPGSEDFPEFGAGHEMRLANLRKLVERAKRYGIDVYLYVNEPRAMPQEFFDNRPELAGVQEGAYLTLCTSQPRVRQWVADSLAHVFRETPGLGGVFTITASENLTNCASHGQHSGCQRCSQRTEAEIIAEINAAIAEGVHRAAPGAKVIAWDWGWNGHGDARETIAKLPDSAWLMSVSEWSLPIRRGGVETAVGEYSMSAVGPGPRAERHWSYARERGLKTVAKVQLNLTWELAAVPYLPVLDLVAEHCRRLAAMDVDGMMLSWSLGGYPSINLELAREFAAEPLPDVDAALQAVAERHYGVRAAPLVRAAWTKFSRAFQEYPYHGTVVYNGPQQWGPANLLHAEPTGYAATMVGLPYDDLRGWRGPYPPRVFAEQFQKVAEGWREGVDDLEAAQRLVPAELQAAAAADFRVAQAAQLHFESVGNQARFVMARDERLATRDEGRREVLRQELLAILDREIALARRMYALSAADSRLGFEASNHYFYVPLDLAEKVVNCTHLQSLLAAPGAE